MLIRGLLRRLISVPSARLVGSARCPHRCRRILLLLPLLQSRRGLPAPGGTGSLPARRRGGAAVREPNVPRGGGRADLRGAPGKEEASRGVRRPSGRASAPQPGASAAYCFGSLLKGEEGKGSRKPLQLDSPCWSLTGVCWDLNGEGTGGEKS